MCLSLLQTDGSAHQNTEHADFELETPNITPKTCSNNCVSELLCVGGSSLSISCAVLALMQNLYCTVQSIVSCRCNKVHDVQRTNLCMTIPFGKLHCATVTSATDLITLQGIVARNFRDTLTGESDSVFHVSK